MNQLNVRLSAFEGPLDLLLYLIEKNEIDIYDIPIAEMTGQYFDYIENHNMESMSEFVLMAATLLEIKSKMLLPLPPRDTPDADPRQALVEQLIEYKRFKQAAEALSGRSRTAERVFRAPDAELLDRLKDSLRTPPHEVVRELLHDISLARLFDVFENVVMRQDMKTDKIRSGFNAVRREAVTVDEKITFIRSLLSIERRIRFRDIFADGGSRFEVVVTFLAVLELIKRKEVLFRQDAAFGDIVIFKNDSAKGVTA